MTKDAKLAAIAAERGPLEHQLYSAEIEVETKTIAVEHGVTGVTKEALEEAQARMASLKEQIAALDERKAQVEGESE